MRNARVVRAKLLLFLVKYADLYCFSLLLSLLSLLRVPNGYLVNAVPSKNLLVSLVRGYRPSILVVSSTSDVLLHNFASLSATASLHGSQFGLTPLI